MDPEEGAIQERKGRAFLREAGIDLEAMASQPQEEGAKSIVNSWNELLAGVASKSTALRAA
jgi:hypothetical protein